MGNNLNRSNELHEKITNRKPNHFLYEQVKRNPEIVSVLLDENNNLKKNLDFQKGKRQQVENESFQFASQSLQKDNVIFKDLFEQVKEDVLPSMKDQLNKLEKLDENTKKKIKYDEINKYFKMIPSILRNAPYWSGMQDELKNVGEDIQRLCFEMNQINKNNITEETYDALFELEVLGIKIIDIYNKIKDPNHFNRKEIDSLKNKSQRFSKLYYKEVSEQSENIDRERQKGPVVNLMSFLTSRFIFDNQRYNLTSDYQSRFANLIKMKFDSFDDLIDYIFNDENPYREKILAELSKKILDLSEENQIKIIERSNLFAETEKDNEFVSFGNHYVKNVYMQEVALKLLSHNNHFVREYLLYNEKLPKNFMFDKIIPVLMNDENQFIKEEAKKLYNTILK